MGKLFKELKRRNVVRVGVAYIVLGWVTLQVADILLGMFETPGWVGKSFAVLLLLGFPFACLLAWAFEMTPEGVKKTADVDRSESITHSTGRKLDFVIIGTLVVMLGYFIWDRQGPVPPAHELAPDKSIAVLPFVNLSSDQEQGWFADGLTEEILNSLARTPDLLVASRTSSFRYKGKDEDISTIAQALGVAHILEGSVRRGGDRLRVTAQLIRTSDGFHLWSETFDREPKDVIAIQENVAIEIANALKTAMDPDALQRMVSTGTASVAAYEAYLEGLALKGMFAATGNIENWAEANTAFELAVSLDDTFALAFWQVSRYREAQIAISNVATGQTDLSYKESLARFRAAINATVDAEGDELRRLKYRANRAINNLRLADARRFSEQYLRQYPNDIEGLEGLINTLASMRDAAAARLQVNRLAKISADAPWALSNLIGYVLFVGLHEEAAQLAHEALAKYPQHSSVIYQAHRALLWNGAVEEARRLVESFRSSDFPPGNHKLMALRQACAEKNNTAAESLVEELVNTEQMKTADAFIALQIMNKPREAHQLLIDANLDIHALGGLLIYPYFNHTFFPELAKILEQQSIDRPFIGGPPYRCNAAITSRS